MRPGSPSAETLEGVGGWRSATGAVHLYKDHLAIRRACQVVEQRYGLRPTASADRTANPEPTRAEAEHAARQGRPEPVRVSLRRTVTAAAATARTLQEFFAALQDCGLLVRARFSSRTPGQITGYAVGMDGYTDRYGEIVYFSGGRLAPDLSFPKLVRRWDPLGASVRQGRLEYGDAPQRVHGAALPRAGTPGLSDQEYAQILRQAAEVFAAADQHLRGGADPRIRAGVAWAASDALHLAAHVLGEQELWWAADRLARAAREPWGQMPHATPQASVIRLGVRVLALATRADRTPTQRTTLAQMVLLANIVAVVETLAALRAQQQSLAQARAATAAAGHLHTPPRRPQQRPGTPPAGPPCPPPLPAHLRRVAAAAQPRSQEATSPAHSPPVLPPAALALPAGRPRQHL